MTRKTSTSFHAFLSWVTLLAPILLRSSSNAFSISSPALKAGTAGTRGLVSLQSPFSSSNPRKSLQRSFHASVHDVRTPSSSSTTSLSMYNLPQGGGGGGGKNELADIAKSAFSLLLVVGFFISPLGGLVLGLFNSFLVLLFVLPLVATVGFKTWETLNTIKGPCPNCGAPVTVIKNKVNGKGNGIDDAAPAQSICFNCGSVLQGNEGNTEINNVSGRKSIDDLNTPMGGGASIFDFLSGGGGAPTEPSTTTTTTTTASTKSSKVGIDKSAVIDVDVKAKETTTQTTSTTSSNKKGNKGGIDKSAVIDVDVSWDDDKPFQ